MPAEIGIKSKYFHHLKAVVVADCLGAVKDGMYVQNPSMWDVNLCHGPVTLLPSQLDVSLSMWDQHWADGSGLCKTAVMTRGQLDTFIDRLTTCDSKKVGSVHVATLTMQISMPVSPGMFTLTQAQFDSFLLPSMGPPFSPPRPASPLIWSPSQVLAML